MITEKREMTKIELHEVRNNKNGFRFYAIINNSFEAWADVDKYGILHDGTFNPDSYIGRKFYTKIIAYMMEKDILEQGVK